MELRKLFFVYCVEKLKDGRYVLLNRYYKPVGSLDTRTWVDYEPWAVAFRMTPQRAARLSWKGATELDRVWLYNDASIPTDSKTHWDAYSRRLQLLAEISIKESD